MHAKSVQYERHFPSIRLQSYGNTINLFRTFVFSNIGVGQMLFGTNQYLLSIYRPYAFFVLLIRCDNNHHYHHHHRLLHHHHHYHHHHHHHHHHHRICSRTRIIAFKFGLFQYYIYIWNTAIPTVPPIHTKRTHTKHCTAFNLLLGIIQLCLINSFPFMSKMN